MPLNIDPYLYLTYGGRNGFPIIGSFGVLGVQGDATAVLSLPPGSPLFLAGTTVRHACIVIGPPAAPGTGAYAVSRPAALELVSNVVSLTIFP